MMRGREELLRHADTYFPQREKEPDKTYRVRKSLVVVHPFYQEAVSKAVGSLLRSGVRLDEERVPETIRGTDTEEGYWANIALRGQDGDAFLHGFCTDALGRSGISYILSDYPRAEGVATQADAREAGLRPYWVHIPASSMVAWSWSTIAGRLVLQHCRFREEVTLGDGEKRPAIKELVRQGGDAPVLWRLYVAEKPDGEEFPEEPTQQGEMQPHTEIPISWWAPGAVPGSSDPWEAVPPMKAIAEMNLRHTLEDAEASNDRYWSCNPVLYWKTNEANLDSATRQISPSEAWVDTALHGELDWKERSGSGAKVVGEELQRLEERMRQLSNLPHTVRTGETATGEAIRSDRAATEIQHWSQLLEDCLEAALDQLRLYEDPGLDIGSKVSIDRPVPMLPQNVEGLKMLRDMVISGLLSHQTLLEQLVSQGILPEDFDVEAELERVGAGVAGGASMDLMMSFGAEPAPIDEQQVAADASAAV